MLCLSVGFGSFNRNYGFFIVILMVLSWIYATFGLLPLLSLAGPVGDFLDFSSFLCPKKSPSSTAGNSGGLA